MSTKVQHGNLVTWGVGDHDLSGGSSREHRPVCIGFILVFYDALAVLRLTRPFLAQIQLDGLFSANEVAMASEGLVINDQYQEYRPP